MGEEPYVDGAPEAKDEKLGDENPRNEDDDGYSDYGFDEKVAHPTVEDPAEEKGKSPTLDNEKGKEYPVANQEREDGEDQNKQEENQEIDKETDLSDVNIDGDEGFGKENEIESGTNDLSDQVM